MIIKKRNLRLWFPMKKMIWKGDIKTSTLTSSTSLWDLKCPHCSLM